MDEPEPSRQELLARIALMEEQNRILERQYIAVINSTIWRFTAPLRRFAETNRALRGAASGILRGLMGKKNLGGTPRLRQPAIPGRASTRNFKGFTKRRLEAMARFAQRHPPVMAAARRVVGVAGRVNPRFRSLLTSSVLPAGYVDPRTLPPSARGPAPMGLQVTSRFVIVEFKWLETVRPADHSKSTDIRQLAAGFAELWVRDPSDASRPDLARINFRTGGDGAAHMLYGFGATEDWGAWTTGSRSSVLLWLPEDAPETCTLNIRAGIFSSGLKIARAEVTANGAPAGKLELDGKNTGTISIPTACPRLSELAKAQNVSLDRSARPDVSILVLNYNKPALTLASVLSILRSGTQLKYEIIVLDNGSSIENAKALRDLRLPVKAVRLRANRFFGEGNNIAAEAARAPLLLFLNNDAFLAETALDELMKPLMLDPTIGAVGPVFRYPDGSIQEAGAFIKPDGTALQRGKIDASFDPSRMGQTDAVDYVSAACLAIRRDDFMALGGFDLRYDPAYYEDSDLCLRLLSFGKRTVVASQATTIHVENATTSDPRNRGLATDIVERHRQIFLSRWSGWLQNRKTAAMPDVVPLNPAALRASIELGRTSDRINAVYTPFPLVHGGGERYILGVAQVLSHRNPTAVATPDEYSGLRLNTLVRELGYEPYASFPEVERALPNRDVDHFVMMGNELLPALSGYGDKRVYHCQFPFPTDNSNSIKRIHLDNLRAYGAVVVNSKFTREAYLRDFNASGFERPPRVEIIPPPVRLIGRALNGHAPSKENIIACIGRFSPRGHAKRQDVVIEAFAQLVRSDQLKGWRLVMCGVVPNVPDAVAYYNGIERMASETPGAEIMLSPSRAQIDELLCRAKVYVSATGFGVTDNADAWRCEHFGITVVEAASAGCVPVAFHSGGPVEIIQYLGAGFLFGNAEELRDAILQATRVADDSTMRTQIIERSDAFSEAAFLSRWDTLLDDLGNSSSS